jgi:hypothetical protein
MRTIASASLAVPTLFAASLFLAPSLHAQATAGCGCTGASIPSLSAAEMRKAGTWKLSMDYAAKYARNLITGTKIDRVNAIGVKDEWTKVTVGLDYGITNRLTVGGEINYSLNSRSEGNHSIWYSTHGIGDAIIGARYWLAEPDLAGSNFYVGLDTRLPTGADDQMWMGAPRKSYQQVGTGQLGLIPAVGFYKGVGNVGIVAKAGGIFNFGKNDWEYESADGFIGSLGGQWVPFQFGPEKKRLVGLGLHATAIVIPGHDKKAGVEVGNSGGTWTNIVPSISFSPDAGNFTSFISVPVPAYTNTHGLQCFETHAVSVGGQVRF